MLLVLPATTVRAGDRQVKTLEAAATTVRAFGEIPLKGIPRSLLHDAAGVAVIPEVVKAGLLIDGRFGRGVILVHEPDGSWSSPVFVSISGGGVGGVAGVETTELVLVFKTRKSLDRVLEGKIALGGDLAVAAGPVGRDTETAANRPLAADIYSYSRSRGLFVGLSLEGSKVKVEHKANEVFYGLPGIRPSDVLGRRWPPAPPVELLRAELGKLSGPVTVISVPQPPPLGPPVPIRPE
jgi:lipid-binding SYLF domain-containing protein